MGTAAISGPAATAETVSAATSRSAATGHTSANPYGYGSFGPYGYYGGGRTGSLESLAPGTFIIDIIDGNGGELIWRGWANGALSFAPDVDELPDFIGSVVHDVMEEFPPDDG